ncbi:hypothetical protein [Acaryochloris sp. CCMEE 5410]|uniref:hypothetical protein n=1 Tax=Acaryochloris sp. CCMEE 5410 TaxID=310037 RepID=UPI0002483CD9|nr:hypothetical protein [Acaryochloris sp. CCMEE 5410]KAI9130035.1 hypothetical protein ON05_030785 [Acaryochloris sp. CCMEE 5410]
MDDTLNQKIHELAVMYEIPENMLREAIAIEQEKVVLKNRPGIKTQLLNMVERYAALYPGITSQEDE